MGLGVSGAGAEGEEPLAVSGKRIIVWKTLIVAVVAVVVVVVVIIKTIIKLLAIIVAD